MSEARERACAHSTGSDAHSHRKSKLLFYFFLKYHFLFARRCTCHRSLLLLSRRSRFSRCEQIGTRLSSAGRCCCLIKLQKCTTRQLYSFLVMWLFGQECSSIGFECVAVEEDSLAKEDVRWHPSYIPRSAVLNASLMSWMQV